MFGAKPADVEYFSSRTLSQSVDELLTLSVSSPAPPLNYYEGINNGGNVIKDPDNVPLGQTWVNGTYGDGEINFYRGNSIRAWWLANQIHQGRSIEEKMVLFWHNHFATQLNAGGGATGAYRLIELFRKHAVSNLRTLMIEVSKNTQMLHYLNGFLNTKWSPDENYARELQELFGTGKGPDSKYTEEDVREAARLLTGHTIDWATQTYKFESAWHDTGNKTFSNFYGGATITGKSNAAGASELDEFVDLILNTNECSKFIVRKIYKFFINYHLTPEVEADIITPLAATYKSNGYNLKPILKTLFESEHFYETQFYGSMIKSPIELIAGFARESNLTYPAATPVFDYYKFYMDLWYTSVIQQQGVGDPPNVAGWPAYYQAPMFTQVWVNSDTLPKRINFTVWMLWGGYGACCNAIEIAKQFSDPGNPNKLMDDLLSCMYRYDITSTTLQAVKTSILLSGQTQDYYWTDAWNDYVNNPNDANKKNVVETRLRNLVLYFVQSPHYQMQ